MGRRLIIAFVAAVIAYVAGAFGGGLLVSQLTGNTHDASVEAALASEGFDVDHVRDVVLGLSAALRTLLPDQETHRQAQQSASPDHG